MMLTKVRLPAHEEQTKSIPTGMRAIHPMPVKEAVVPGKKKQPKPKKTA